MLRPSLRHPVALPQRLPIYNPHPHYPQPQRREPSSEILPGTNGYDVEGALYLVHAGATTA